MPTRERRLREATRKAETAKVALIFDQMKANAPDYAAIAKSKGQDPFAINNAILSKNYPAIFNLKGGLIRADSSGDLVPNTAAMAKGQRKIISLAAALRREDVQRLQKRYPTLWGRRGKTRRIAEKEGLSVRTVQKYFKEFPLK